jgi:hypothetical protein
MPPRERRPYGQGPSGNEPDSDVIRGAKVMTNAGTAAAAGVVSGARVGGDEPPKVNRVIETP